MIMMSSLFIIMASFPRDVVWKCCQRRRIALAVGASLNLNKYMIDISLTRLM